MSHFPKKIRPKTNPMISAAFDFYLSSEMITQDEYEALLVGDMSIESHNVIDRRSFVTNKVLYNRNKDHHPTLKTGQAAILHQRRAVQLIADLLTGVEPKERVGVVYPHS